MIKMGGVDIYLLILFRGMEDANHGRGYSCLRLIGTGVIAYEAFFYFTLNFIRLN